VPLLSDCYPQKKKKKKKLKLQITKKLKNLIQGRNCYIFNEKGVRVRVRVEGILRHSAFPLFLPPATFRVSVVLAHHTTWFVLMLNVHSFITMLYTLAKLSH
jgi:hypothetical protein